MGKDLKDEILTMCTGYDATYVSKVLAELQHDVVLRHVVQEPTRGVCPKCGKDDSCVVEVSREGDSDGDTIALMVYCKSCCFGGPRVYQKDLPSQATPTLWRWKAIEAWNAVSMCDLFEVCDKTFGKQYQYDLFHEETVELIEALFRMSLVETRYQRGDRDECFLDVVSEMADVIISIYQWLYSTGTDFQQLDDVVGEKISRTCNNEYVRTAILGLSKRVMERTKISSVYTAVDASMFPK